MYYLPTHSDIIIYLAANCISTTTLPTLFIQSVHKVRTKEIKLVSQKLRRHWNLHFDELDLAIEKLMSTWYKLITCKISVTYFPAVTSAIAPVSIKLLHSVVMFRIVSPAYALDTITESRGWAVWWPLYTVPQLTFNLISYSIHW